MVTKINELMDMYPIMYKETDQEMHEQSFRRFFNKYSQLDIYDHLQKLWQCYRESHQLTGHLYHKESDFLEELLNVLNSLASSYHCDEDEMFVDCSFSEHTLVSFDGIVSLLKQAIPIGTIYNISGKKDKLDLIIVLEKCCGKSLETFENVIDMSLLGYPDSVCTLHTFGYLKQQMLEGNFFYSSVCIEKNVVYRKSTAELLPCPCFKIYEVMVARCKHVFDAEMKKASSFLSGAINYIDTGSYELAVFMLQQTAELTYRCFLNIMRGKDIKCHSLIVLRRNLKRFAPYLIGIFSADEKEELHDLEILEKGYCDARYNREYTVTEETVSSLYQKVSMLHQQAFILFADKIKDLQDELHAIQFPDAKNQTQEYCCLLT
ncbi:HEPN domain-containing protein [Pedobacter sp.]|uniref:HEPN domain-containing protein n=1 Tax=Pedobacter sp. TaxID=1411316 RepID=UPI00396CF4C1